MRGLKNRIAIRLSGSERAMLDEAERTLVNLLRGEAGSVAGEKYSFVRATDAEQIARAQELEAQGENAKTIWSETHLTRDGGGAWVREINDRGAKPRPDGDARGEKGGRLADYLEHPELYEAVPGIADINVKLGMLPESEKRDLPQALAAQGLTGGMSESALAGMYNSYGNNRNTIDRGRNESLAALLDTLNSKGRRAGSGASKDKVWPRPRC